MSHHLSAGSRSIELLIFFEFFFNYYYLKIIRGRGRRAWKGKWGSGIGESFGIQLAELLRFFRFLCYFVKGFFII